MLRPMIFPSGFVTSRLRLRPIAAGDAEAIFAAYARDAEVTRYLTWRPHASLHETEALVAASIDGPAHRTYVLTDPDGGSAFGAFDLRAPAAGHLSFGYVLARAHWGQGLMTEALTPVVHWALARPGIWRIGAVADIDNIASARVMQKAGLVREGILRRWLVHPSLSAAPRDCVSYAAVRD